MYRRALADFGSWEECLLETGQRDDSVIATVDREVAGLKAKVGGVALQLDPV